MPDTQPLSQRREAARTAVVWQALTTALSRGPDQTVVDIGGGTGGFAVRLAELGHRVTVVDPSPDALAALARRAAERGVSDRVLGEQGDLAGLREVVDDSSADLVLCHGVLEIVDDHDAALDAITAALAPSGTLSLLVAQRHAAVLARAMAGHFTQALALLDGADEGADQAGHRGPRRRFTSEELTALLDQHGYATETVQAIRVFADLVPGSLLDLEPGAAEALVHLEQAVADRPEFRPVATQLHALARRA